MGISAYASSVRGKTRESADDADSRESARASGSVFVSSSIGGASREVLRPLRATSHRATSDDVRDNDVASQKPAAATTARAPVPRHATFGHASLRRSKSAALPRRRDRRAPFSSARAASASPSSERPSGCARHRTARHPLEIPRPPRASLHRRARANRLSARRASPRFSSIVIRNGILLRLNPRHHHLRPRARLPHPSHPRLFLAPTSGFPPRGSFLGGAPANVACHLNELGRSASA